MAATGTVHSRHWWPGTRDWVLFQADLLRQLRRRANLLYGRRCLQRPTPSPFSRRRRSRRPGCRGVPGSRAPGRRTPPDLLAHRPCAGSLGGTDWELKRVPTSAVPAFGLALWWRAYVLVGHGALTSSLLLVILVGGVLGAVYRTATRPPMSMTPA